MVAVVALEVAVVEAFRAPILRVVALGEVSGMATFRAMPARMAPMLILAARQVAVAAVGRPTVMG